MAQPHEKTKYNGGFGMRNLSPAHYLGEVLMGGGGAVDSDTAKQNFFYDKANNRVTFDNVNVLTGLVISSGEFAFDTDDDRVGNFRVNPASMEDALYDLLDDDGGVISTHEFAGVFEDDIAGNFRHRSTLLPFYRDLRYDVLNQAGAIKETNDVTEFFEMPFRSKMVFVDISFGDDATGRRENQSWPFRTPWAAKAAALAGDTIVVYGGAINFNPATTADDACFNFDGNWYLHTSVNQVIGNSSFHICDFQFGKFEVWAPHSEIVSAAGLATGDAVDCKMILNCRKYFGSGNTFDIANIGANHIFNISIKAKSFLFSDVNDTNTIYHFRNIFPAISNENPGTLVIESDFIETGFQIHMIENSHNVCIDIRANVWHMQQGILVNGFNHGNLSLNVNRFLSTTAQNVIGNIETRIIAMATGALSAISVNCQYSDISVFYVDKIAPGNVIQIFININRAIIYRDSRPVTINNSGVLFSISGNYLFTNSLESFFTYLADTANVRPQNMTLQQATQNGIVNIAAGTTASLRSINCATNVDILTEDAGTTFDLQAWIRDALLINSQ